MVCRAKRFDIGVAQVIAEDHDEVRLPTEKRTCQKEENAQRKAESTQKGNSTHSTDLAQGTNVADSLSARGMRFHSCKRIELIEFRVR